jgi:hypothetical protein
MNIQINSAFLIGSVFVTKSVLREIAIEDIEAILYLHAQGDWGEICDTDKSANEVALRFGGRLRSAHESKGGIRIYIFTESDRSVTVVHLSNDLS